MLLKASLVLGLGLLGASPSVLAASPAMGRPVKPVVAPAPPIIEPVSPTLPIAEPQKPITDPASPAPIDLPTEPEQPITNPTVPTSPTPPASGLISEHASCGSDTGKVFLTSDGSAYKLQCSYSAPGLSQIGDSTAQTSFAACMEKCSSNYLCNSVQFNARPGPGATPPQGDCVLFKENLSTTTQHAQYDFAVQVDPPTHDEEEVPTQLCTTSCPLANGMPYSSSYGETFIMDCGKRHGTKYLSIMTADNFQDCMEICAATVPCHSVDYQAKTKKCYLASHHGSPSIVASSFDSARSIGCAGACGGSGSCCGGSSENRKNITKEQPKGPDTSCGNQGFAYAIYPNQKNGVNMPNHEFEPTIVKNILPYFKGTTTKLGVADVTTPGSIYGQTPKDAGFVIVDHRGYLYAQQDGEYIFSTPKTDDQTALWLGPNAYSGWTRPNANIDQTYVAVGGTPVQYKSKLGKGKYYPIRLLWANSGGAGNFAFKITAPDGSVVIDDKSTSCPDLVQYGCKAEYDAPPFPAWGAEA